MKNNLLGVELVRTAICLAAVALATRGLAMAPVTLEPAPGATVPLLDELQKKYVSMDRPARRAYFADGKRADKRNFTHHPRPVRLKWRAAGSVRVDVRRRGRTVFQAETTNAFVDVWNLEIARDYEWTVTDSNGVAKSAFRTEDIAPRLIRLPGVPNVRDLGGRTTADGRRVKQGMIYRSGGLAENATTIYGTNNGVRVVTKRIPGSNRLLRAKSQHVFTDELGIRTDIDLRTNDECYGLDGHSPAGPSVKFFNIPSGQYGSMCTEGSKKAFAAVFRVLLDETNYPVDIHCIMGQDRTGAAALILNALLDVDEDELYKDWEESGFWGGYVSAWHTHCFDRLIAIFDKYPGSNLKERIASYVRALGFTDADIAKFRAIMTEPDERRGQTDTCGGVSSPSPR